MLFCVTGVTHSQAQEMYSGIGYEKMNFKTDDRISQNYDTYNW